MAITDKSSMSCEKFFQVSAWSVCLTAFQKTQNISTLLCPWQIYGVRAAWFRCVPWLWAVCGFSAWSGRSVGNGCCSSIPQPPFHQSWAWWWPFCLPCSSESCLRTMVCWTPACKDQTWEGVYPCRLSCHPALLSLIASHAFLSHSKNTCDQ